MNFLWLPLCHFVVQLSPGGLQIAKNLLRTMYNQASGSTILTTHTTRQKHTATVV